MGEKRNRNVCAKEMNATAKMTTNALFPEKKSDEEMLRCFICTNGL
jgi:hypothetical protein